MGAVARGFRLCWFRGEGARCIALGAIGDGKSELALEFFHAQIVIIGAGEGSQERDDIVYFRL